MDELYTRFSRLKIDRPHPRVLRVVMNRPDKLNAADGEMHSNLTEIWRVIDADASVNAVLLTGAGKAFSAGGDLELVGKMMADFDTRMRVWKEATSLHAAGYSVTVLSPMGKGYERRYEVLDGIHVYRHPLPKEGNSPLGYVREYSSALFWEFFYTWWI